MDNQKETQETISSRIGAIFFWIIAAIVIFFVVTWWTGMIRYSGYFIRESTAVSALTSHGFKDVTVIKRNCSFIGLRGGGQDDRVRFTCEATNPAGQRVMMYVYSGILKGATIRTP